MRAWPGKSGLGGRPSTGILIAWAVASGCSFQSEFPAGAVVRCTPGGAPCPSGWVCREALGTCITQALAQATPAAVIDGQVLPAVGNAETAFTADFEVTSALAFPPKASAIALGGAAAGGTTFAFACQPCTAALACHCAYNPNPSDLPPDGPLQVEVSLVDQAGNTPAPTVLGTVQFDTAPPALVAPATLQLTAPPGVDTEVAELGNGAGAEVCFTVDEALRENPEVFAGSPSADGGKLLFSIAFGYPQEERSYCYQATLDPASDLADGPVSAFALATDLAGNSALLPLVSATDGGPLLVVDRTPPPLPNLGPDGGVRYHRAPWGELPTIGSPQLALASAGPALSKPGTLVAYADPAEGVELGRAFVGAGQPVQLTLNAADEPAIWIDEVDLAGNRLAGGAVEVRQVDWVLNLGGKVKGDTSINPNDCYARPQAGPTLGQADDANTALDALHGPIGTAGQTTRIQGAASWRQRFTGVAQDLDFLLTAYDPVQGKVLSLEGDQVLTSFDGIDWSVPQALQPGFYDQYGPRFAFDQLRGRVVSFGGMDELVAEAYCNVWELGPAGWSNVLPCSMTPDGGADLANAPAPRIYPCMAYDPDRHQTLVLGGEDVNQATLNDLWAWDGTGWTPLPSPPPMNCQNLAYDRDRDGGAALVALGFDSESRSTTWIGLPTDAGYAWSEPLAPFNAAFGSGGLVLDRVTGLLATVVSLAVNDGGDVGELWTWDGSSPAGWQVAGILPGGTGEPSFGLSPMADRGWGGSLMVLISGFLVNGNYALGVLSCQLEPFGCSELHAQEPAGLPDNYVSGLAFDPSGDGLVTLQPFYFTAGATGQTWLWSLGDWVEAAPTPSLVVYPATIEVPSSGTFWQIGGYLLDGGPSPLLWIYSLDAGWSLAGSDPELAELSNVGLIAVADAGLPGVLGATASGSIELVTLGDAGISVEALSDGGPVGVLAFDYARNRAVVLDGSATFWEAAPPAFQFHPVAGFSTFSSYAVFDAVTQRLLWLNTAGATTAPQPGGLSEWDGTQLTPIPVVDAENDGNPDSTLTAAYDPRERRVRQLVQDPQELGEDTWDLNLGQSRPGLVCQFRVGASRLPPQATFSALQVQAVASAAGPDGGAVAAVLSLWNRMAWSPVQQCDSSSCLPLTASLTEPAAIAALFDDLDTLGIEVAPSVENGPGLAEVDVESVQATLTYQLP